MHGQDFFSEIKHVTYGSAEFMMEGHGCTVMITIVKLSMFFPPFDISRRKQLGQF